MYLCDKDNYEDAPKTASLHKFLPQENPSLPLSILPNLQTVIRWDDVCMEELQRRSSYQPQIGEQGGFWSC